MRLVRFKGTMCILHINLYGCHYVCGGQEVLLMLTTMVIGADIETHNIACRN